MPVFVLTMILAVALNSDRLIAEERAHIVAATEKPAAEPRPGGDEISRWIEQLSHDAFSVRQAAASRLLTAGMSARDQLTVVADGPDPETRAAARRLVALIDQSEFYRRLEAFAADTDGHQGFTLPGWAQFQKLAGSDAAARSLFVDMQRHEGSLLSAAFGISKRSPSELLESRLLRLIQWQNAANDRSAAPPVGSCAAVLFLGSVGEIDVSDNATALLEVLVSRPPIFEALRAENQQEAVRRLVVGWLVNSPTRNEGFLQRRLDIISNASLEEALPLAFKVIAGDPPHKRVHPYTRALAVLLVGQLGKAEHVDRLEPLLDDASLCVPPGMQFHGHPGAAVQIRDVALVVMLQLTNQRPADYGYMIARTQSPGKLQLQTLFRDNNQQRVEAIAKWREWRAAQKPPAPTTGPSDSSRGSTAKPSK
jgi:hypothetical protein